jgi:hypothetical protein
VLIVTEPAADLQLLSEQELRVAAGLEPDDDSQDATLATLGLRASSALAAACGIAKAGYDASLLPLRGEAPRTLKAETLVQSFRVRPGCQYQTLSLGRWPVLSIISVTENTTELMAGDWDLDIPDASLTRVSGNETLYWPYGRVTVEYEAGFDIIPEDLKGYASSLVSLYHQITSSAPDERRVEIPGVITVERWIDPTATDSIVPEDIARGLLRDGYRRLVLA